ncbi:MAG TPA: hypothetical protein VGY13_06435 [Solirubrobacteraceae bacterium]|jgi:hypothetical protein|nr:hypothetical protein [Solirubrobacteraceae bacterium]
MKHRDWPPEPPAAAETVVRAVRELDASTEDQRDALLYDLVSTAWGCIWALDQ